MADTISLVSASIKDVLLSQRAPQTGLEIPFKASSPAESDAFEEDIASGDAADADDGQAPTMTSTYGPNFTDAVIDAVGPNADPRMRTVMPSLVRHLHDFCRENEVTGEEYMAGIELINAAGKMSDNKRNETQLLLAILGVESLVDEISFKQASDPDRATATATLGPFHRKDAPRRGMGDSIVPDFKDSPDHALIRGRVLAAATGEPVANAELDVRAAAPNGLYEQQDPEQPDMDLRGRFTTGQDGAYSFRRLRPTKSPIPDDGPAGRVLRLLDRQPWRPGHVDFIVSAPGYRTVVMQIFDQESESSGEGEDVAVGVKEGMGVDFVRTYGEGKALWELEFDFRLVEEGEVAGEGVAEPAP